MVNSYSKEGVVSEWNEGMLKSRRLSDIQTMINASRSDLLGENLIKNKKNYETWVQGIGILFSEGGSKYSDPEKKQVKKIRDVINEMLLKKPPYIRIRIKNGVEKGSIFKFSQENFQDLVKLGDLYEEIVRQLNDKHGLTTKNVGTGGLFD